jgi:hypothetical protein
VTEDATNAYRQLRSSIFIHFDIFPSLKILFLRRKPIRNCQQEKLSWKTRLSSRDRKAFNVANCMMNLLKQEIRIAGEQKRNDYRYFGGWDWSVM